MLLEATGIELFYGASHALRDVSVTADAGKVTCVLGRNGVGKTSLLRAIFGLERAQKGSVKIAGQEVGALPPYERARRGMALVPQGREIFPRLTVLENLMTGFAPLNRGERRIPDDVYALFPVLRDMLRRRGGDLSGGQQQQLAIARALVTQPKVLVLDEPTEGIQPSIIKDIGRALKTLAQRGDMAILLVEQYFDFARELGDVFHVMSRGKIVLTQTAADARDDEIRRLLTV